MYQLFPGSRGRPAEIIPLASPFNQSQAPLAATVPVGNHVEQSNLKIQKSDWWLMVSTTRSLISPMSMPASFAHLFVRVLALVFIPKFKSARAAASSSAVFLIAFLLVHVLGNLIIFKGADAFNQYGHSLRTNPILALIEIWLAIAFVAHAIAGVVITKSDKKLQLPPNFTFSKAKLVLTGTVLAVFIIAHLKAFRFGPELFIGSPDGGPWGRFGLPSRMRDLYRLQLEIFSSPLQVTSVSSLLLVRTLFKH